jgi:hypothetical protein
LRFSSAKILARIGISSKKLVRTKLADTPGRSTLRARG